MTSAHAQYLDADRRAIGERVTEVFRWTFLVALAVLNNFSFEVGHNVHPIVNGLLGGWAVFNLVVTVLLLRGHRPSRAFGFATTCVDILFGSALVFLSNGLDSPYFLAFFLTIIAASVRFGTLASVASALVIAVIYLFIGGTVSVSPTHVSANLGLEVFGRVFLFLIVALVTGVMARELLRERGVAVRQAAETSALYKMSSDMAASLNLKDVFQVILHQAVAATNAEEGLVVRISNGGLLVAASTRGEGELSLERLPEAARLMLAANAGPLLGEGGKELLVGVPAVDDGGLVICLRSATPFSVEQQFVTAALARAAATPVANALRYQSRTQEAITDPLTGLSNRREFRHQLELEISRHHRSSRPFAVLMIDLDHFKTVNDSLGHQKGDEVLKAAAELVRQNLRPHDFVARFGGDELAAILPEADEAAALAAARRLVNAVRLARLGEESGSFVTFSIGVAGCPGDGSTIEDLVQAADQALYFAKRQGRNQTATCRELVHWMEDPQALARLLRECGRQVIPAVARAIDEAGLSSAGHLNRVVELSERIGRHLGLTGEELAQLRVVAHLHNVGVLIGGSGGEGVEGSREVVGAKLLTESGFSEAVTSAVRHHHERFDGMGFPDRLAGEAIPLAARIVSLASAFEAMISGGLGREPRSLQEAMARLLAESGRTYDPELVQVLRSLQDDMVKPGAEPNLVWLRQAS